MKKIFRIYDKAAEWLCNFGSDKYVHLLVGLVFAFLFALLMKATTPGCYESAYAFMGVVGSAVLMVLKEVVDLFRGESFDAKDTAFGIIGGIIGGLMFLM